MLSWGAALILSEGAKVTMEIVINEHTSKGYIKLDFDTSGLLGMYDLLLSATINYMGYSGEDRGWFVMTDELTIFTTQLRTLEEQRKGKVILASIGINRPGEFRLEMWALDRLGHIAARAIMRRTNDEKERLLPTELSVAFTIDTEKFGELVSDFEALLKQL